jgi:ATP-dependent exoDNAse (exonuclease V) beta subunit
MTTTGWQPADQAARDRIRTAVNENMCVEAGAGTGKTSVLVDRIVEILRTGHARVDSLVVITFTEKAAAELSARVRRGLEAARAASGDDEERARLDAAIQGLNAAHIETIHAFAASLLRERPIEAGLDPGFEVLDELPRQLAFEAAWNEWVTDEMAREPAPAALVEALNVGLEWKLVREAAQRLNSHRDVLPLAPYAVEAVDVDGLIADMRDVFAEFDRDWENNCGNPENVTLLGMRRMRELHGQIIALHARGESARPLIAEVELPNVRNGRKEDWRPHSTKPKDLLTAIRRHLEVARARIRQGATAGLMTWVAGFVEFYSQRRKAEGKADFDDLLVWARDLVRDDAGVRAYFQEKYRCVLVDEFQDTDPLQAEMIVRLCAAADPAADQPGANWRRARLREGSLFAVGDPKQSIYRFRRADITMYDDVKAHVFGGTVVEITQNFRSVKPVIDWVNASFSQLIQGKPGVQPHYIALDHHPAYRHGAVSVVSGEAPHVLERRQADIRIAEAKALASLIQREIRVGTWLVRDARTDALRPAEYRDVAVLIPRRTELHLYEEQLSLAGIPYRHEGGRTFFLRQEVRELVAILRALDDPGDEVAVIAALRSPAFACSDEDLFLHKAKWKFDYYGLPPDADGVVADSLRALRELSRRRHEKALPEYVRDVIDSLRLVEFAMLQHQGEQAASNVLKIIDQARAFSAARRAAGLRGFVRWLKENIARTSDETDASITEETDDAVRIVTVHMSKGLEFGVVLFANMSTDQPDWTNVIVTRGVTGGMFHVRLGKKDNGFCTPGYEEAEADEAEHSRAEQLRLLYVASTRARDHLVVPFFHWESDDPRRTVKDRRCLNDHFRSVDVDVAVGGIDAASLPMIDGEVPSVRGVDAVATADDVREIIEGREGWQAARQTLFEQGSVGLRVHTASALKPAWETSADVEHDVQRGRATDFGSAVHDVLERIDFARVDDARVLAEAVAKQYGMSDRVDEIVTCVENVLGHEIMARAQASNRVLRETAFTAPLPPAGPDADDGGLAEGRIDLLFAEDGGVVVVDFKTDRVSEAKAPERAAIYRNQALVYAWAAQKTTGLPVREVAFLFARGPFVFNYPVDAAFMAEAEALLRGAAAPA